MVDCGAWGTVRRKLELVGSTRGACPEVCEILVELWIPLVEGVKVELREGFAVGGSLVQ